MLHLRITTPEKRTDDVVALLTDTIGATRLVVRPGAARSPAGDVVLCDVAREAADDLLGELRRLILCAQKAFWARKRKERPVTV